MNYIRGGRIMYCDSCGAPIENGKCKYCGKTFPNNESNNIPQYQNPTINININQNNPVPNYSRPVPVTKPKKKNEAGTILLILVILFVLAKLVNSKNSDDNSGSVWAQEVTPISKFEYYLDGNYVHLTEYKGKDKKVKIGTSYEIDGKNYKVAPEIEDLFVFSSATSVIIPEGITSMPSNTFNSSDIKYVYIPKSLKVNKDSYGFYKYFHDVSKIYYGGSESQWKQLTHNIDRSEIDATEIIYNANVDDLN